MTKAAPKWVIIRYAKLWKKFGEKKMTYENIQECLGEKKSTISVFLNELRNAGWATIELSKEDARKRVYQLKSPDQIFEEINNDFKKSKV